MLALRLPCARTLTLLLALLGIASHVRLYVVLGELQESFPYVPASSSSGALKGSTPLAAALVADNSTHAASTAAAWYNILPARPAAPARPSALLVAERPASSSHHAGSAPAPAAQERSTWEAARLVTRTLRGYAAMSAAAAAAGAWGVLASSLLATRIFVLSSFLDLFLFTLSLLSLLLLCTYPEIRSNLCEVFSSGTLAAGTQLGVVGNETTQPGWLARVVEEILAGEECDEAFARDVVPLLLVFSLLYTAIRLYCFLTIHHFYVQLLRVRIHQYLPCSSSSSSGSSASSNASAPRSSATSSRGSHDELGSPTGNCFTMMSRSLTSPAAHSGKKAHSPRIPSRVPTEINEKLA